MNQIFLIWLFAVGIFAAYLLIDLAVVSFFRKELSGNAISSREGDTLHIYANAEALEYYLRAAIVSSENQKIEIVVNIPRTDSKREDMIETVRMMRRKYKNISYRMI
jgi:hypothetical protein